MSRRIGKIHLDLGTVERAIENVDSEAAAELNAVLSKAIPIAADYQPWNRRVAYVALSRDFDEVPVGHEAPEYDVQLSIREGFVGQIPCQTYDVRFVRRHA